MKDYANRNFNYSDVQAQDKVPIHWGFIIAALLAMLVIYSVWHHRQQVAVVSTPSVSAAPTQAQQANAVAAVSSTKTQAVAPAKVTTPPVKFDFYQMLTENPSGNAKSADDNANASSQTVSAQAASRQQGSSAPAETKATAQGNVQYYVEVGSYRSKSDALQQKANLILSEVSPKLIRVVGSNGRYRVLIGPYSKQASAIAERSDLKQNGINGSLIKDSDLKK